MRKPKSRIITATGMTAAECARRTGLTIRALRIYERRGLIRPARSAKGWRLYGPEELIRLNSVVALKDFGLTLGQIRKAFGASPPALAQILDMQLKVWSARQLAAHHAVSGIYRALARLRSDTPLSVDELCELLRNSDMSNLQAITRELINQHITPEQERAWMTYWSQRPEEAAEGQVRFEAGKAIAQGFLDAMRRGEAVDSPDVQQWLKRSYDNWSKEGMRERQLEQFAWNPEVTRAWSLLGAKLLARSAVPDDPAEAEKLQAYMLEARRQSPAARAFRALAGDAARLRAANVSATSAEARALAKRYAAVCQEHDLGDPGLHARWIVAFADFDEETRAMYAWLAKIVTS
jgi:DNA-binding transcriptional MerR regulator